MAARRLAPAPRALAVGCTRLDLGRMYHGVRPARAPHMAARVRADPLPLPPSILRHPPSVRHAGWDLELPVAPAPAFGPGLLPTAGSSILFPPLDFPVEVRPPSVPPRPARPRRKLFADSIPRPERDRLLREHAQHLLTRHHSPQRALTSLYNHFTHLLQPGQSDLERVANEAAVLLLSRLVSLALPDETSLPKKKRRGKGKGKGNGKGKASSRSDAHASSHPHPQTAHFGIRVPHTCNKPCASRDGTYFHSPLQHWYFATAEFAPPLLLSEGNEVTVLPLPASSIDRLRVACDFYRAVCPRVDKREALDIARVQNKTLYYLFDLLFAQLSSCLSSFRAGDATDKRDLLTQSCELNYTLDTLFLLLSDEILRPTMARLATRRLIALFAEHTRLLLRSSQDFHKYIHTFPPRAQRDVLRSLKQSEQALDMFRRCLCDHIPCFDGTRYRALSFEHETGARTWYTLLSTLSLDVATHPTLLSTVDKVRDQWQAAYTSSGRHDSFDPQEDELRILHLFKSLVLLREDGHQWEDSLHLPLTQEMLVCRDGHTAKLSATSHRTALQLFLLLPGKGRTRRVAHLLLSVLGEHSLSRSNRPLLSGDASTPPDPAQCPDEAREEDALHELMWRTYSQSFPLGADTFRARFASHLLHGNPHRVDEDMEFLHNHGRHDILEALRNS